MCENYYQCDQWRLIKVAAKPIATKTTSSYWNFNCLQKTAQSFMQNRGDLICEECGEEDETTACLWRILGNLTEDNDVLLPVHNGTAVLRSPYLSSTLSSAQVRPPRLSDTKDHYA